MVYMYILYNFKLKSVNILTETTYFFQQAFVKHLPVHHTMNAKSHVLAIYLSLCSPNKYSQHYLLTLL